MNYELWWAAALLLGICLGATVRIAIFMAEALVVKYGLKNSLEGVVLGITCFGVIVIPISELLGHFLGEELRQHAIWFWGGFAIGFVFMPFIAAIFMEKKSESKGACSK